MSVMGKSECRVCGGELKRLSTFPNRTGYEIHKFKCSECDSQSRVEIDTRFR